MECSLQAQVTHLHLPLSFLLSKECQMTQIPWGPLLRPLQFWVVVLWKYYSKCVFNIQAIKKCKTQIQVYASHSISEKQQNRDKIQHQFLWTIAHLDKDFRLKSFSAYYWWSAGLLSVSSKALTAIQGCQGRKHCWEGRPVRRRGLCSTRKAAASVFRAVPVRHLSLSWSLGSHWALFMVLESCRAQWCERSCLLSHHAL